MTGLNVVNLAYKNAKLNVIPVDFAVNTIISAAYKKASQPNDKCASIYNSTTSSTNPTTWKDFSYHCIAGARRFPSLKYMMLYPSSTLISNVVIYSILFTLLQILPSLFFDLILVLSGKKAS
jgi:hypothetical protein